jgi:hypothetical protein
MRRNNFENDVFFTMETSRSIKPFIKPKHNRRMRYFFDSIPDNERMNDQTTSDASDLDSLSEILGGYVPSKNNEAYVSSINRDEFQRKVTEPFPVEENPAKAHLDSSAPDPYTKSDEKVEEKVTTLKDRFKRSVRRVSKAVTTAAYRSPESRIYRQQVDNDQKGEVIYHGNSKVVIHCETYDAGKDKTFTREADCSDNNKTKAGRAVGLSRIIPFRGLFRNGKKKLLNCRRSYFDDLSTDSSSYEDEVCHLSL